MNTREAVSLIEEAVRGAGNVWADIGAGSGVFTRALMKILGPRSVVYAVDRDAAALDDLKVATGDVGGTVVPLEADFTQPFALPGIDEGHLDGLLVANALHFVSDAGPVLARLVKLVKPAGRIVVVEYDRREASQWVPYPVSVARLKTLAEGAGLTEPNITATRPSRYEGVLYVAVSERG